MDTAYFKEILHELNNGGYEALMYYLMHYPIDKFNLREAPKTEALLDQKLESLPATDRFWYTSLYQGELIILGTNENKYYGKGKEYMVIKYKLFNQYQRFANKKEGKNRSDEVSFGMRFSQFFPMLDGGGNIMKERNGKNMKFLKNDKFQELNCYIIPTLAICRLMFEAYIGHKIDWPDDGEWVEKQYNSD
jgi:hypothetical protein